MNPRRRHDDPRSDVDPDEVEAFYAALPVVLDELERGRRRNRRLARIAVAIGLFVLAAWLTVAHAQEKAADQDRRDAYVQCRLVNDNALALNQFIDRIVVAVRQSPGLTEAEKADRVKQYLAIKQQLPVCRRP